MLSTTKLLSIIFGAGFTFFGLAACNSTTPSASVGTGLGPPRENPPVITSIGVQAILPFEHNMPLTIPIEGFNFSRTDISWTVEIQGVKPISSSDITLRRPKILFANNTTPVAPDRVELEIPANYFDQKVKSQDPLQVTISIFSNNAGMSGEVGKLFAKGTRQFILMQSEDYREKYLSTCIGVQDISAFPLSEHDAMALFGGTISKRFYVVELSIRNQTNIDQLVSTGMIQAYGRALVIQGTSTAQYDGSSGNLLDFLRMNWGYKAYSYTIPVQIAPISREHAYTIASDQNKYKAREWTIRSLVFAGSLATAVTNGFYPNSTDALRAVGIYGNVFIPGFKELWPDPLPANLSNLVNYSMPELMKVPSHTAVGHKYIFFSKEQLQGMIPEPGALGIQAHKSDFQASIPNTPQVSVVYFSFDTMHIPFENIKPPQNQAVETIVQSGLDSIEILSDDRDLDFPGWSSSAAATAILKHTPSGDVSLNDLNQFNVFVSQIAEAKDPLPAGLADFKKNAPDDFNNLQALAAAWKKTAEALLPDNMPRTIDSSAIRTTLATNRHQLQRIQTDIRSGYSPDLYRDQANQLANQINKLRDRVTFLESIIDSLGSLKVDAKPMIMAGFAKLSASDALNLKKLLASPLVGLGAARGSSNDFPWLQTAIGAPTPTTAPANSKTDEKTAIPVTLTPTTTREGVPAAQKN